MLSILNNHQPRFTIICTVRANYRCFFDELLSHIVSQTEKRFECIFITDQPGLDWVKGPDDRFIVICLNNELPLAQKRNIGIQNSNGEYIIFCDADDYFDKNLLTIFSDIIDHTNPDFILPKVSRNPDVFAFNNNHVASSEHFLDNKEEIVDCFFSRYLAGNDNTEYIFDGCWGKAFRRSILMEKEIRFLEEPCRAEDALFVNDFVLNLKTVCFIDDYYGYYWRLNNNSEMFNVNSFFYNIVPFTNKLVTQLKLVSDYYSKDFAFYISLRVVLQAKLFCKARINNEISKKVLYQLLNKSAPQKSLCAKCLKNVSWKYGSKHKVLSILYYLRLYALFYFAVRIHIHNDKNAS